MFKVGNKFLYGMNNKIIKRSLSIKFLSIERRYYEKTEMYIMKDTYII